MKHMLKLHEIGQFGQFKIIKIVATPDLILKLKCIKIFLSTRPTSYCVFGLVVTDSLNLDAVYRLSTRRGINEQSKCRPIPVRILEDSTCRTHSPGLFYTLSAHSRSGRKSRLIPCVNQTRFNSCCQAGSCARGG